MRFQEGCKTADGRLQGFSRAVGSDYPFQGFDVFASRGRGFRVPKFQGFMVEELSQHALGYGVSAFAFWAVRFLSGFLSHLWQCKSKESAATGFKTMDLCLE